MSEPAPPARDELKRILEAILFAHDAPVTPEMVIEVIDGVEVAEVRSIMSELGQEYREQDRSFEIVRVAGGYQICTREAWSTWVGRFQRGKRRVRLSRAAVETLGIIAFRQPVTRGEIEEIRGVDTGGVIHTLLERNLIAVKGRAKTVGRPLLYVTTLDFLEYFGLDTLDELPQLEEIEELIKESADILEEIETETAPLIETAGDAETAGEGGAEADETSPGTGMAQPVESTPDAEIEHVPSAPSEADTP